MKNNSKLGVFLRFISKFMKNNFAKFGIYLKFMIRRERIMSTIWIACIAGFTATLASLYPSLLATQEETIQMATTMSNPAMVAMMGNVYGMENLTQASVMAQECQIWFFITIAIMNIFLINRHTRVDEELGRLEMFRALPVGRLTGTMVTIKFALFVNLIISLLTSVLLLAVNIGGITILGAFVYGFSIGAVGFVFAALTLLVSQLFSTAHGVTGMGFTLLGLFYILRAVGDVSDSVLSYISPLGLGLKVEAFYSDAILPLIILFIEGVVISILALVVCAFRDHGLGVIPAKKGKSKASRFLCSPFGLAWRLSKGTIIGWGVGMLLLGASYGSVCSEINEFVEGNEMMQKVIGMTGTNTLLDSYVAMIFIIMSMIASVPVVLTAIKIYSEEKHGRLEQIYGRAVPRLKLYGSFVTIAVIESIVMQLLLAIGLGGASGGELSIPELIKAGFCYLPALWVMTGGAILLVGAFPKMTSLIWAVFGYTFMIMYIGRIMSLPKWVEKTTPFGNISQLPIQEFNIIPLIILTLIAVVLTTIGIWRYRTRDIG